MTTVELTKGKQVSPALMDLITKFTTDFVNTAELWEAIKMKAEEEGFTTEEITLLIRPMLKTKLTKDQIYYLFHKEEQKERVQSRKLRVNDDKNDIEQIPRPKAYRLEEEFSTVEQPDNQPIGDQAVDVVEENKTLRTLVHDQREIIAKLSVATATEQETNLDRLFEMLPSDDVDTFKNKSGNLLLFERLLVNFKIDKNIKHLQWWVRVIK